jgi:hypothetical protein
LINYFGAQVIMGAAYCSGRHGIEYWFHLAHWTHLRNARTRLNELDIV